MAVLDLASLKKSAGFRQLDPGIYTNDASHAQNQGFVTDGGPTGYKSVNYADFYGKPMPAPKAAPPPGNLANDVWMNGKPPASTAGTLNIPGASPLVPTPAPPDPWLTTKPTSQMSTSQLSTSALRPPPTQPSTSPVYNTTPMWQDAHSAPTVGDPYYADWAKANPTYQPPAGQRPFVNAPGGAAVSGGNLKDPAYVDQLLAYWGSQPGVNPSVANDPNYWRNKILSGELGGDENYIIGKFRTPEGAPAGGAGGGGTSTTGSGSGGFGGGTYEQALAFAQQYAQQHLGHALSSADIQGFLSKYGGGPGTNVGPGGLAPVLADIDKMGGGGVGNTGSGGVPIDPNAVYPGNLFNDPGTQLLEDTIKARLNELFAPTNDPALQQVQAMIASRISDLQKPVYSDGQEATIHSAVFDGLEHDRQNEIQTAIERMAGLGHGSGSGTVAGAVDDVNRRFDTTRAQSQNQLALAAIDAQQQRADQAVQLAGSNYDLSQGVVDQETARRREALSLVSTLADIPGQRLQLAEQASGMAVNPSSISDQILKLMTNSQTAQDNAANRRSSLVTGIGSIVGSILAGQLAKEKDQATR